MKIPSSYLQYSTERLKEFCEIQIVQNGYFWNTIPDCEPTPFLVELLDRTAAIPKKSAKSTAECIVAPILVEMWK